MKNTVDWSSIAQEDKPSNEDTLNIISELAGEMLGLDDEIEALAKQLSEKQKARDYISNVTLPEAMLALGLTEIKHVSGRKLIVQKFYSARIPEDKQAEAFAYLEKTGNDSIIKTDLTARFGKGEKEDAEKAATTLGKLGVMCALKTSVHPQTLKAYVKEQIESGVEGFPQDLFGVYTGNVIKVK